VEGADRRMSDNVPYLPMTPEQITNEAVRAREACAAVVHSNSIAVVKRG